MSAELAEHLRVLERARRASWVVSLHAREDGWRCWIGKIVVDFSVEGIVSLEQCVRLAADWWTGREYSQKAVEVAQTAVSNLKQRKAMRQ